MGEAGVKAMMAALAVATALAGCTTAEPGGQAVVGRETSRPSVSIATAPLSVPPPFALIANDTCGANVLGWLVGRSRTQIPIPTDLSHRRVTCATCSVSQDYRPDRLNILFDAQTGMVTKLSCG